jgi:hypothetical protein
MHPSKAYADTGQLGSLKTGVIENGKNAQSHVRVVSTSTCIFDKKHGRRVDEEFDKHLTHMLNISIKAQRCKDFKMCLAPQRNAHFSKKQFMNMIELIKKALWFGQTPVYCLPNMLVGTGGMSFPLFHLES